MALAQMKEQERVVPAIRFPEFQDDWRFKPIVKFIEEYREKSGVEDQYEVMTSSRAGLVRQREYYDNERITERDNVGFNVIPPGYVTYRSRSDDRRFFFNINELGITGIISTYYPVFKVVDGSPRFFSNILLRYSHFIGKHSVGTSQTVLSLNELKKIKLPFPKQEEQQKIASFLGAVDQEISQLTRKKELLEEYKKGIMQKLFSQEIRFKDDDGHDFPDWEDKPLYEFMLERNTQMPQSENYPLMAFIANIGVAPKGIVTIAIF